MNTTTALKVPANIVIESDGSVYRYSGNSGVCIGRLDDFAKAVYVEGQPHLSKHVASAQDGLDYLLRNASFPLDESCIVGPVGGYSVRDWCKTHQTYVERNQHVGRGA